MTDYQGRLKRLLDDLHKLEINTIEKPNLTAQKMPSPVLAVHQIYHTYQARLRAPPEDETLHETSDPRSPTTAELHQDFDDLKKWADRLAEVFEGKEDPNVRAGRIVYIRISGNCASLSGIMERAMAEQHIDPDVAAMNWDRMRGQDQDMLDRQWPNLSPGDRAQIRKIWEIGTENVLMQTVIQIEGDVITRMNSAVARGHHPEIVEVHKQSVEISLLMWGQLVNAAERLLSAAATLIGNALNR